MSPAGRGHGGARGRGEDVTSRRRLLAATGAVGATLLAGCTGGGSAGGGGDDGAGGDGGSGGGSGGGSAAATWRTTELAEVRGEETFTLDELSTPVVVQSFAVWCSNCQRQSENLAGVADSVTVVGLNTDPNEDASKVRKHAEGNGWDWRFAVAPSEMTRSLIDDFGTTVTNAPSTPLIFVCGDGSAKMEAGSISSTAEVEALAEDC